MASRPAESYDEGPGAPKESVSRENGPLMRCVGRFWLVSGWRTPQSVLHAPEDLSRASERIRRVSRQMCRNRLLPVVVWVRFGVEALVRQL